MLPDGYEQKGATAIVRMDTGDIIAKTSDGSRTWYEVHISGGASWFGLQSLDDGLRVVARERGHVA